MAKPIYVTPDEAEEIMQELRNKILTQKYFGGLDIKRTFKKDGRRAAIYFTQDAWNKMIALVAQFETEVQWHGLVNRLSQNEFIVYDIIVPPHVVSSSTVTSDYAEYNKWINDLDDDTFNAVKFHGHSHVNMACSPSSTDMKLRQDVVTQLPAVSPDSEEDSFYIFLIRNKRWEWTGEIYDLKYNALYSTDEIELDVYTSDGFLSEYIAQARKVAIKETPKSAIVTAPLSQSRELPSSKNNGQYQSKKKTSTPSSSGSSRSKRYEDDLNDPIIQQLYDKFSYLDDEPGFGSPYYFND